MGCGQPEELVPVLGNRTPPVSIPNGWVLAALFAVPMIPFPVGKGGCLGW